MLGTLCDLEYECPNRISKAPVLLPAEGGFPFGRRPMVLLAVGELFVRARSARSQARSACVIARRRRLSIRPKTERFARRWRALCPYQARSDCVIARRRLVSVRPKAERFARRRRALYPGAKRP